MQKPKVWHGVGTAVFYDLLTGREVLRITKQTEAAWTFGYEETKVMGGSDLDMIDSFETSRAQSVTFTDAVFDIRQLEVATGKQVVQSLSQHIMRLGEGGFVPDAPGPYTYTLDFSTTALEETVRVRYNDTWEDFAPVPTAYVAGNVAEVADGAGNFTVGDSVVTRITTVLTSGVESCSCTAPAAHVVVAAKAYIDVTMPDYALVTPTGFPIFDVNQLSGFNVYVTVGAGAEYLSNAAPIAAGAVHRLTTSPGAGAGSPDATPTVTGQYTVTAGVITFAAVDAGVGFLVDYIWTTSGATAECEVVDVKKQCLRRYLKCVWTNQVEANDGTTQGFQMEIFKCKYTGDYAFANARADAATFPMKFDILDPERPDGTVVKMKRFPLPAGTNC